VKKSLFFPIFNTLIGIILGGFLGYVVDRPAPGLLLGGSIGLGVALLVEWRLKSGWLYRWRALWIVLLEIPLAVFVIGPFWYAAIGLEPTPHPVCCETPLDYGAATFQNVRLTSADGVTLVGWYVPPRPPQRGVVIILHGSGGDRRGGLGHARPLMQAGLGVLLYDERATGESTGGRNSMGWADDLDVLAALDYLSRRPEVDLAKVGVIGLSRGAHIALTTAYLHPGRLAAVWADGVSAQQMADFPPAESSADRFELLLNDAVLKMTELLVGRPAPPAFIQIIPALNPLPVTIIQGEADDFERRIAPVFQAVAGPNTAIWVIPNAGHCGGIAVIPEQYTARMVQFFQAALR
jgi:pimeloyl-ACP methyl ester carboxylesterase